jgi:glycosyltransferase involved in cell wall biosynthesis
VRALNRKLIILGIRGIPAAHGGFETFAARLSLWLHDKGWDVTVYCQGSVSGKREEDYWEGIRRIHIPVRREGSIGTIEFDCKAAVDALYQPGIILTLGYNTGFLNTWLMLRGRKSYINMDGLEWKRNKYGIGQRAYLWINERLAAWSGQTLIADHPAIADHLATRVSRSKIAMIPYGADEITAAEPSPLKHYNLHPGCFFTLIARAVPENSVLELVKAFSAKTRGVKLALLGSYNRAVPYQAAVLDAASSEVVFTGGIYDQPTLEALRFHSIAYLHGHRVGGTNPSLVEALGAGNAVIAHQNRFNRWVAGASGIYFSDEAEAEAAINLVLEQPAILERMRYEARARWKSEFTWDKVLNSYQSLLDKGELS